MKEVVIIKSEIKRRNDNKISDQVRGCVDLRVWANMQRPISNQALDQAWFQTWEETNENS